MEDATGSRKLNCWELQSCGRGPGGSGTNKCGTCPAATKLTADGTNGGVNGGRVCWAIAGTMCGDKPQGTFAIKFGNCLKCPVFLKVKQEEAPNFLLLPID